MSKAISLWKLSPFDYFVCGLGVCATIFLYGIPDRVPRPIIFFSEVLSATFFFMSACRLCIFLFVRSLNRNELNILLLYFALNLPAAVFVLTHLTETPWEALPFP